VSEKPAFFFIDKRLQLRKRFPVIDPDGPFSTCGQQAFFGVGRYLVLVVIQKTKSAEPLCPVQHFFFYLFKITDRKCAVSKG
jgi:hypothetical protein